jgi:hypothetical protein
MKEITRYDHHKPNMSQFLERHLLKLIFGGAGALFLLVGLIFVGVGISSRQDVGRLETIPVLDLAGLRQSAGSGEVALEGKISERNPFQFRPFVAYIRQEYQGQRCDQNDNDNTNNLNCRAIWVEDERVTPPLWLDLPGGRANVANTNYELQYPPFAQQSSPFLIARQTKSYQGFRVGDPVFVLGQVVSGDESPVLQARVVSGGNRESYLANARGAANIFTLLGSIFTLLGGVLLVILIGLMLRGKKGRR